MKVVVDIEIARPSVIIWPAITDIGNCSKMIPGIKELSILNQPEQGLVGLKWRETRVMFGQEASETMWITEAIENEYYCTRAESHGSVYITKLSLSEAGKNTLLTMSFTAQAQTLMVKLVSACMGGVIRKSMKKALLKDLQDIKNYIEQGDKSLTQ